MWTSLRILLLTHYIESKMFLHMIKEFSTCIEILIYKNYFQITIFVVYCKSRHLPFLGTHQNLSQYIAAGRK